MIASHATPSMRLLLRSKTLMEELSFMVLPHAVPPFVPIPFQEMFRRRREMLSTMAVARASLPFSRREFQLRFNSVTVVFSLSMLARAMPPLWEMLFADRSSLVIVLLLERLSPIASATLSFISFSHNRTSTRASVTERDFDKDSPPWIPIWFLDKSMTVIVWLCAKASATADDPFTPIQLSSKSNSVIDLFTCKDSANATQPSWPIP
mmetsp:Transcript_5246/g.8226  ORF Transcript_5246/g.8226 Transcript_5246/m.8226 type:complete len:208 (-) Transcript_5246:550-1173(-)